MSDNKINLSVQGALRWVIRSIEIGNTDNAIYMLKDMIRQLDEREAEQPPAGGEGEGSK